MQSVLDAQRHFEMFPRPFLSLLYKHKASFWEDGLCSCSSHTLFLTRRGTSKGVRPFLSLLYKHKASFWGDGLCSRSSRKSPLIRRTTLWNPTNRFCSLLFSEEEALKRDVFQDLFALYESRILPPAKSDEEVIERIGEAFTIKKVDDPTADEEWAIRLSEEKRVRYATPRFQIYKIIRDEKSALLYDNSLIKNGSYYSIIYDTQEKRFIDEVNDFIFLFKYYRGIEIGRNQYFFRNYLNNLRKVNDSACSPLEQRCSGNRLNVSLRPSKKRIEGRKREAGSERFRRRTAGTAIRRGPSEPSASRSSHVFF